MTVTDRMTQAEVAAYLGCDLQALKDRRAMKVGPFPTLPCHHETSPDKYCRVYFLRHEVEAWATSPLVADWLIGHTAALRPVRKAMREALVVTIGDLVPRGQNAWRRWREQQKRKQWEQEQQI